MRVTSLHWVLLVSSYTLSEIGSTRAFLSARGRSNGTRATATHTCNTTDQRRRIVHSLVGGTGCNPTSRDGHLVYSSTFAPPTLSECCHRGLAGLSIPARGSSAADLTTRYIPSRTACPETDWVGKSHRAPTPGPDNVVAWHSCSCR